MKLNIKRFAPDPWDLTTFFSDYKYNANGELTQVTLTITSNYNINSIYDIDNEGNELYDDSSWENYSASDSYPHADMPYIRRTFYNLNNLKGVKLISDESRKDKIQTITYNFKMTTKEHVTTTYLTKTSATAVLKGNVLNSLNTYDYNNAPSVAAVRNYFESGNAVQSQKEWLKNLILETTHPIGSLEINTSGINPSEYLGGTWEAFGSGRTLVGVDSSDSDFDTVEETGGEKTHTLTVSEIPSHYHNNTINAGGYTTPPWKIRLNFAQSPVAENGQYLAGEKTGGGESHNNLQPYITVYFWKRIA